MKPLERLSAGLKECCSRYVNGKCDTLACLKRGGYKEGDAVDYEKATCPAYEAARDLDPLLLLGRDARRLLLEASVNMWELSQEGECPNCDCEDGEPHDVGCLLGQIDGLVDKMDAACDG